jgi:hypothetical protein
MADSLKCLIEQQHGKCPYTGISLVLGHNASLDHKASKSRGGSNDLSNLQWVYYGDDFDVNMMKRDTTEENFVKAINIMYENFRTMAD